MNWQVISHDDTIAALIFWYELFFEYYHLFFFSIKNNRKT